LCGCQNAGGRFGARGRCPFCSKACRPARVECAGPRKSCPRCEPPAQGECEPETAQHGHNPEREVSDAQSKLKCEADIAECETQPGCTPEVAACETQPEENPASAECESELEPGSHEIQPEDRADAVKREHEPQPEPGKREIHPEHKTDAMNHKHEPQPEVDYCAVPWVRDVRRQMREHVFGEDTADDKQDVVALGLLTDELPKAPH